MPSSLASDLKRVENLAFSRVSNSGQFLERFHASDQALIGKHPDFPLLEKIYAWMFVPYSLWPIDVKGLGLHVLAAIQTGKTLDAQVKLLAELLPEPPARQVCDSIAAYERAVISGSYESLINAQFKFDSMEEELARNETFKSDWARLKAEFAIAKFQNPKGVIRRRMVQERNFRPRDWKFAWENETIRFQQVFDAFCHRWNLYGMEHEKPLLLKLSVNLTPFSTMIEIPKYWSFDPKRDLQWGAVTKLHKIREVKRQGPKLSPGRSARQTETNTAKHLWAEATQAGLKGERRDQWVMGRLGWDARTDERKLRRMLENRSTGGRSPTGARHTSPGQRPGFTVSHPFKP